MFTIKSSNQAATSSTPADVSVGQEQGTLLTPYTSELDRENIESSMGTSEEQSRSTQHEDDMADATMGSSDGIAMLLPANVITSTSSSNNLSSSVVTTQAPTTMVTSGPQWTTALYPYTPQYTGELSLLQGQRVTIIDDSDPDSWLCQRGDELGFVPSNYLDKVISTTSASTIMTEHTNQLESSNHSEPSTSSADSDNPFAPLQASFTRLTEATGQLARMIFQWDNESAAASSSEITELSTPRTTALPEPQSRVVVWDLIINQTASFLTQPLVWQESLVNERIDWAAYSIDEQMQLLRVLEQVSFQHLRLQGCQVFRKDFRLGGVAFSDFFAKQSGLLSLQLSDIVKTDGIVTISGSDIAQLGEWCPNLENLHLENLNICENLVFEAVFLRLRCLSVHRCQRLKQLNIDAPQLAYVSIQNCAVFTQGTAVLSLKSSVPMIDVWESDMLWRTCIPQQRPYFHQLAESFPDLRSVMPLDAESLAREGNWQGLFWWGLEHNQPVMLRHLVTRHSLDIHALNSDNKTALHLTIELGYIAVLDCLRELGVDIHAADSQGLTPLMYAVAVGNQDSMDYLVTHGANVNAVNSHGQTALMLAVAKQDLVLVEYLIAHGADVNAENQSQSVLMQAVTTGHIAIIDNLASRVSDIDAVDNNNHTALMHAVMKGDIPAVDCLVAHGADVYKKRRGYNEDTLLHLSATQGHLTMTRHLIERYHMDSRIRSGRNGYTAVSCVPCSSEHAALRTYLKEIEAKQCAINLALREAAQRGNIDVIEKCVSEGAYVNDPCATEGKWSFPLRGMVALQLAAANGHLEAVELLVNYGADVNVSEYGLYGDTPFNLALEKGHSSITRFLLSRGAMPTKALDIAVEEGKLEDVILLLNYYTDLNIKQDAINYALCKAAWKGHTNVVKLLVEQGADVTKEYEFFSSNNYLTALQISIRMGHVETTAFLLTCAPNLDMAAIARNWVLYSFHFERQNHLAMLELLVKHGFDVTTDEYFLRLLLDRVITWGFIDVVRFLLTHKIKIDSYNNLKSAVESGHNDIIDLLVTHGADPHACDNEGNTILMLAVMHARYGVTNLVKMLLLTYSFDISVTNHKGQTVGMLAQERDDQQTLAYLAAYKAGELGKDEISATTPSAKEGTSSSVMNGASFWQSYSPHLDFAGPASSTESVGRARSGLFIPDSSSDAERVLVMLNQELDDETSLPNSIDSVSSSSSSDSLLGTSPS